MISVYLNSTGLILLILIIPFILAIIKKRNLATTVSFAYLGSIITGWFIKKATSIPRPFMTAPQVLGVQTNIPQDYSFPSIHTMTSTTFAWSMTALFPKLSPLWFSLSLIISFSRILMGVHYFQDIYYGFILATIIFWSIFFALNKKELIKPHSNIKRKFIHLLFGLGIIFSISRNILSTTNFLLIFLLCGQIIILIQIPQFKFFRKIIQHFERSKDNQMPAIAVWLYLFSCLAVLMLFPRMIALAAIANLAVGDSINALVGYFYHLKPKQKTVGAAICALITTVLISLNFVGPTMAVAAATTTSFLELMGPKIKGERIDDNIWFPIVAALAMVLV